MQRIRQGGLVHDPAARDVEDEGSAFRRLQLGPADESAGLRRQRGMYSDHVRPMQELREADQARTGLGYLLRGQERVAREDPHLAADGASGDGLADLPEPDDAEGLSPQLGAGEARALPLAGLDRCVRLGEMADEREQEGDRVLRRGDRVAGGRIDHHHAGSRRGVDVDPVDPDARHAHHAQARRGSGEQLGVDPRLRAHDQRVPPAALAEQVQQLAAGVPDADLGVVRVREVIDRGLAPPTRPRGCVTSLAPSLGAVADAGRRGSCHGDKAKDLPVQ